MHRADHRGGARARGLPPMVINSRHGLRARCTATEVHDVAEYSVSVLGIKFALRWTKTVPSGCAMGKDEQPPVRKYFVAAGSVMGSVITPGNLSPSLCRAFTGETVKAPTANGSPWRS